MIRGRFGFENIGPLPFLIHDFLITALSNAWPRQRSAARVFAVTQSHQRDHQLDHAYVNLLGPAFRFGAAVQIPPLPLRADQGSHR